MAAVIHTGVGGPGPPLINQTPMTSYADKAKMNVRFDQRLKRNVLDIEVEKNDARDEMFLDQSVIAKLLRNIGMNIEAEVDGYQVAYGGKTGKIAVLCKTGVDIEKYCRKECFEVCKGVTTKNIRPSGRKDVTVTVSGLDFNTPDSLVQEYITKFGGTLVSNDVIYARHGEGPFKGKLNGDRKYQVDMTAAVTTMGTYHYLDGERIRVYYRGNTKTCGRCHQSPQHCKGGGIARECQEEGGVRKDLIKHMKDIWAQIDFSPTSFTIPEREGEMDDCNYGGDQNILESAYFPRQLNQPSSPLGSDKFTKAKINNFPKEITVKDAISFLTNKVDKNIAEKDVEIVRNELNSQIILGPGPSREVVSKTVEVLDFHKTQKQVYEGRKLYAKLLQPLSPVKSQLGPLPNHTQPEQQQGRGRCDSIVKSAVVNLENKKVTASPTSQARKSSAATTPIAKHKQGGISSRSNKK